MCRGDRSSGVSCQLELDKHVVTNVQFCSALPNQMCLFLAVGRIPFSFM